MNSIRTSLMTLACIGSVVTLQAVETASPVSQTSQHTIGTELSGTAGRRGIVTSTPQPADMQKILNDACLKNPTSQAACLPEMG